MERKKTFTTEKFRLIPDPSEFLPKVSSKPKESPLTPIQIKSIRKKYSDISAGNPESEIDLVSKILKNDSKMLFQLTKFSEERKIGLHLPVLVKNETKTDMGSSFGQYTFPNLSPSFTKPDLETNKRSELSSPSQPDNEKLSKIIEVYQDQGKRGSSATRGIKTRKKTKKSNKYFTKNREDNLDILLMNKNKSDFPVFMNEYARRQGLLENSKIFILTGQHEFMRRALKKRNWIENKNSQSQAFHFKWCYNDTDDDYKNLKFGQLFNHFLNNRELTTKSDLSKNLRNVTDCKVKVDNFFPRSYDLGDNFQIKELILDYQRTSIFNILKKYTQGYFVEENILKLAISFSEKCINSILSKCEKLNNPEPKEEDYSKLFKYKPKLKTEPISEYLTKIHSIFQNLKKIFPQFLMEGDENI